MEIGPVNSAAHAPVPQSPPLSEDQLAVNRQAILAIKALNKAELLGSNNELAFQVDHETQRLVIQIVDRQTKEVVQQIPPEYVIRAAESLQQK